MSTKVNNAFCIIIDFNFAKTDKTINLKDKKVLNLEQFSINFSQRSQIEQFSEPRYL